MITLQTVSPRKQFARGGNGRTTIVRNPRTNEELIFPSRKEANDYITANYIDPNFYQGNLSELVVRGRRKRSLWEQGASNFKETFGITPKTAVSFLPYVGDAVDSYDIYNNLRGGNYINAAISAGLLAIPNILEKPAKLLFKSIKNQTKKGLYYANAIRDGRYYPLMTKKQKARYEENALNKTKEVNNFLVPIFEENLERMALSNRFDGTLIGHNTLPLFRLIENKGRNSGFYSPFWNQINVAKFEPNSRILKNMDEIGNLYAHELGHYFNRRTPYTSSVVTNNGTYNVPNMNHRDINIFRPIIENNKLISNPRNKEELIEHLWKSSPDEAHAELYRHRWINRNNNRNGYINDIAIGVDNFNKVVFDFQNKFNLSKNEAIRMILTMQRPGFKHGGHISLQEV